MSRRSGCTCKQCRARFVPVGTEKYCSARCAKKARMARRGSRRMKAAG